MPTKQAQLDQVAELITSTKARLILLLKAGIARTDDGLPVEVKLDTATKNVIQDVIKNLEEAVKSIANPKSEENKPQKARRSKAKAEAKPRSRSQAKAKPSRIEASIELLGVRSKTIVSAAKVKSKAKEQAIPEAIPEAKAEARPEAIPQARPEVKTKKQR